MSERPAIGAWPGFAETAQNRAFVSSHLKLEILQISSAGIPGTLIAIGRVLRPIAGFFLRKGLTGYCERQGEAGVPRGAAGGSLYAAVEVSAASNCPSTGSERFPTFPKTNPIDSKKTEGERKR